MQDASLAASVSEASIGPVDASLAPASSVSAPTRAISASCPRWAESAADESGAHPAPSEERRAARAAGVQVEEITSGASRLRREA
jgi:hypothetical protein